MPHRRRQEDPGRQNPCRRRQIRHPAGDRCLAGEPACHERYRAGSALARRWWLPGRPALGDLGYRGERLAKAGETLGITVAAIARGRDGRFVPAGICRVVERSFAWLSRYRRLNTVFERSKEHLIAFVAIAFISILARRLKRLVTEQLSA